jgi:hypothetical protein
MNTLKTLTVGILMLSASYAVEAKPFVAAEKTISAPAFTWGSPEDLDLKEVEMLKSMRSSLNTRPDFVWGTPEDLDKNELQILKVQGKISLPMPAFGLGSAEDLGTDEVEALREKRNDIAFPVMIIGDPMDIQAEGLR